MYDVAVALGETGTLGMVREASSWSAGQVGRTEQHPAMCRAELAGTTGVLDTTQLDALRTPQLSCRIGWREGRGRRTPGQNRAHLRVPAPHQFVYLSLAQVRGGLLAILTCAAPSRAAHRRQLAPRSGNNAGTRTLCEDNTFS